MPTQRHFPSSRVVMYAGDHPPPHVHVQLFDGRECTVALHDLGVVGRVAARQIRGELDWIATHREALRAEWRRLNP